jgi:hypothetical protein
MTISFSETSVSTRPTKRHNVHEDSHLYIASVKGKAILQHTFGGARGEEV